MSIKSKRKGIILAGGKGTRLNPLTKVISKQLLPIYNKPMIYYALSVLMLSNIKEILIISQSENLPLYSKLLGDGSQIGISIEYKSQDEPRGIPDALIIGEEFIKKENIALILGDNIFYGSSLSGQLLEADKSSYNTLFCTKVENRSDFGILELDKKNKPKKIIEKPKNSNSNLAVTGLYFYNNDVIDLAKKLKPSARGELEITDINNYYLYRKKVQMIKLYRGTLWLDTGTFENLHQCSSIIYSIEKNIKIMIGCIEEIALNKGWISAKDLEQLIKKNEINEYNKYLINIGKSKKNFKSKVMTP